MSECLDQDRKLMGGLKKRKERGNGWWREEIEVLTWTHIWWRWQHSNHPLSLWGDGGWGNFSWCCYYYHQPWWEVEIFLRWVWRVLLGIRFGEAPWGELVLYIGWILRLCCCWGCGCEWTQALNFGVGDLEMVGTFFSTSASL